MVGNRLSSVPRAPDRLPVLGHIWQLWRQPLQLIQEIHNLDQIVRVDIGPWPVYFLTTPELQQQVLTTQAHSFTRGLMYERIRSLFGDGLATSTGELHQQRRRLIQPAFHRQRIATYIQTMNTRTRQLVDSWQPGQYVAFDKAMGELTLDIVAKTLFSRELDQDAVTEIRQLMPIIMKGIALRIAIPKQLDKWPLLPSSRRFDAAATRLRELVTELIISYRRQAKPDDLLSLLLAAQDSHTGQIMSNTEVCDEVLSLLIAGTESPSSTVAWTFYELARHPDVERRLHAELANVVGDGPIAYEHVAKLKYTTCILNEVMRLHPVLIFTQRVTESVTLGKVHIPAGTEIAYSPYGLYRDAQLYPQPTQFIPDRWLGHHKGQKIPFTPFGAGRHKCIGEGFAWAQMSTMVATIATRWQLRPTTNRQVKEVVAMALRPNTLPMRVVARD